MLSSVVNFALATALVAGVATSAHAQAQAAQPGASSGGYKIAVVDRKKVFDEYGKNKPEWDSLTAKKTNIEKTLNAKIDALKAEREAYAKTRPNLSDEERVNQDNAMNKKMLDLRNEAQLEQQRLDQEGDSIIKKLRQEIDTAVRSLAQTGNYHLVLEADTAISSVIYYSDTLDITTQVLDFVKAHAGSAPAPAAPKAEPAADKDSKKPKK
jgi:Skp family chaperone for outer membrane proteins